MESLTLAISTGKHHPPKKAVCFIQTAEKPQVWGKVNDRPSPPSLRITHNTLQQSDHVQKLAVQREEQIEEANKRKMCQVPGTTGEEQGQRLENIL